MNKCANCGKPICIGNFCENCKRKYKVEKNLNKLLKEHQKDREEEFKKTKALLKILERIIRFARREKWELNYLIEELEFDVKLWRERYDKGEENA